MPALDPFHDDDMLPDVPTALAPSVLTAPGSLVSAAADPRDTLARILEAFANAFGANAGAQADAVLTQLAMLLTQYTHGVFPLRLVITGPTGSGKTRLLHTIASVLKVPGVVIPVTDLSETGWRGAQVGDICRLLHPEHFRSDGLSRKVTVPTQRVELPAVILLDEIDKLALTHAAGRFDGTAAAARLGKQMSLLPVLYPLSDLLVQSDDSSLPFRWSLQSAVILCSGAFMQLPQDRRHTAADLCSVGFLPELVERMGPVLTLPSPSAATRAMLARSAVHDVEAFAESFGVRIDGIDGYLATLEAPGVTPHYLGVRGLMAFVRQRMLAAVAEAIAQQRTVIHLRDVVDDA